MNVEAAVRALLAREGINQTTLADRAGVSQSTVSRALSRRPLRQGHAYTRLVSYMQKQGVSVVPDPAVQALTEIWDGSDAHAAALAELVRASRELWPNLAGERAG